MWMKWNRTEICCQFCVGMLFWARLEHFQVSNWPIGNDLQSEWLANASILSVTGLNRKIKGHAKNWLMCLYSPGWREREVHHTLWKQDWWIFLRSFQLLGEESEEGLNRGMLNVATLAAHFNSKKDAAAGDFWPTIPGDKSPAQNAVTGTR
jgi:hypothetical protein